MRKIHAPALLAAAVLLAFAACDDDDPTGPDEEFSATLTVGAEVPPVTVVTNASGSADFEFDDGEMSYTIDVANITGVTASHIHGPAPAGEPAGVLVTLFVGPQGGTGAVNGQLESGSFTESASPVSMDSLRVLMRSGQAYVNVHTDENPDGEIRGQLEEE